MAVATLILLLLVLVAASGVLVRFLPLPLPIIQIGLGILLAWPIDGLRVELEPELFLLVFVPPLLFIDGIMLPKREFAELAPRIFGLAFGLVFFTVVVFGYALNWLLPQVPLPVAFALAAVLSPTDAVAVSSIVGRDLVPARVRHILEGESLLNDASGLVVLRFAVAAALTGQFSLGETALTFVLVAAGGALAGFATLWATAKVLRIVAKIGDVRPEVEVVILILLPFAAYLLAEKFHLSGILAAVTAGLFIARAGLFGSLSFPARMQNMALIEMLSFTFNGVIFLLLGLQLPTIIRNVPPELSLYGTFWEPVLAVLMLTLILLAIRFAWIVFGSTVRGLVERWRGRETFRLTTRLKLVMTLAGVRGAITLAGILSLPLAISENGPPFPARDLVVFIAAGVIICSLVLASVMLPIVARGISLDEEEESAIEERMARQVAAEAAIARIEQMVDEARTTPALYEARLAAAQQLIPAYRQRIAAGEEEDTTVKDIQPALQSMLDAAFAAEQAALRGLLRERKIDETTMRAVIGEVMLNQALNGRQQANKRTNSKKTSAEKAGARK
ncbi:Na+/H+ antiporter [Mesorhizobium retamae]|uniref:Na+/H+ antiporter n=1 Tax=Mesorhizobium retamae TaxID=2912854 RepID=A0ABS9QGG7_9HYPH|nr:Na+/H+ antiporter [Mesorhizobium sp. IRAMC:0171]MCG7505709.1 Na+/H+ antiporter [Mesorhizobium sp. IRAMC:0171]